MAEENAQAKPTGKIEFIENHRPALPSGDYSITVAQTIKATRLRLVPRVDSASSVEMETEILVNNTRLFSIELDFIDELDAAGLVSVRLSEQFQKVKETLGSQCEINVEEPGSKWVIESVDKKYFIQKENQTLNVYGNTSRPFVSQTRDFSVQGPRFTLDPQVIRAVFPPAGNLGEHSSVLPHISFTRSTLPWERFPPLRLQEKAVLEKRELGDELTPDEAELADGAIGKEFKTPWLALLLFDQDELVEKQTPEGSNQIVEGELKEGQVSGPKGCTLHQVGETWTLVPQSSLDGLISPTFVHEFGQQEGDSVTVIDVAVDLLKAILPPLADVPLLGHVRQPTDDLGTPIGDQVATLLANRLPKAGHMSVVHLVSLEGHYDDPGHDIWALPIDAKFVRLVSLKSWRFTCLEETHSFKGLLNSLDRYPSTLRLPSDMLKLASAKQPIERGYVPMPHEMRQGNRSVSWYRGPLAPGQVETTTGSLRVRSADQLVRYNPANGMFDVSYAAAWELGRLLTLQNQKAAVSLLDWKRRHRHVQERQRAMQALEHLPIVGRSATTDLPDLPGDVARWFGDLGLLLGLPFNYLVPDEAMLPHESIRFFWVDPEWIRCLHDGAFSIGRVLPADYERDAAHDLTLLAPPHAIVTGFLLRSEVVSGWPDLQVDGYDEAVPHENYEHETLPPGGTIRASSPPDRALQSAMNRGDARLLPLRLGFPEQTPIEVSPIVADSRWLVNVNENEVLYLVEKTSGGFRIRLENKLPVLRMERLSPNILLCLFAGDVRTVDIHQKPEALHFGLNRSGEGATEDYYRELKSHRGGELPGCVVQVPWGTAKEIGLKAREASKRVISASTLNGKIQEELNAISPDDLRDIAIAAVGERDSEEFKMKFRKAAADTTSAQLALQLTEGVQKVRFVVKASGQD